MSSFVRRRPRTSVRNKQDYFLEAHSDSAQSSKRLTDDTQENNLQPRQVATTEVSQKSINTPKNKKQTPALRIRGKSGNF